MQFIDEILGKMLHDTVYKLLQPEGGCALIFDPNQGNSAANTFVFQLSLICDLITIQVSTLATVSCLIATLA